MLRSLFLSTALALTALPAVAQTAAQTAAPAPAAAPAAPSAAEVPSAANPAPAPAPAGAGEPFDFVLIGDMPYGKAEEVNPPFEAFIAQINAARPDLVVHIGDTKSGSTPCSDEALAQTLTYLNSFDMPLLYSLGDNEWTDCHRKKAGEFDPLDRLALIRKTYFADPTKSFGKTPLTVESDAAAGYPEDARVMHKGVMFVTAHVPGSNNNLEVRDPKAAEEFYARDKANVQWLKDSFAAAKDANALVLAIQADMFEFDWNAFQDEAWLRHSGYANFGEELVKQSNAFGKPVLLMFGDSHHFRMFRPLETTAPFVMALETFGEGDMHGVTVSYDPAATYPFGVRPLMNAARPIEAPKPKE